MSPEHRKRLREIDSLLLLKKNIILSCYTMDVVGKSYSHIQYSVLLIKINDPLNSSIHLPLRNLNASRAITFTFFINDRTTPSIFVTAS